MKHRRLALVVAAGTGAVAILLLLLETQAQQSLPDVFRLVPQRPQGEYQKNLWSHASSMRHQFTMSPSQALIVGFAARQPVLVGQSNTRWMRQAKGTRFVSRQVATLMCPCVPDAM